QVKRVLAQINANQRYVLHDGPPKRKHPTALPACRVGVTISLNRQLMTGGFRRRIALGRPAGSA
ncbi:MAG: hypothetical protein VB137_14685, partial [Burkholderia sp.]